MESSSSRVSPESFDSYNKQLQDIALKATRNAAILPSDINFYRSIDTGLAQDIDSISSRVLSLTNKLLDFSSSTEKSSGKGKGKAKLQDEDDVVDNFHSLVVDVMDQLFERTDACLDQVLGRNKAPAIAINPPIATQQKRKVLTHKGYLDPAIHHASQLQKPQLGFKRNVDNSDTPWYPTLSHKYNAKVPLGYAYTDLGDDNMDATSTVLGNNPYRYEIKHLTYPPHVYLPTSPEPPAPLIETPFTWVSTVQELQTMLDKLREATEIAVDLEHHSYRSYAGFLCLMQISTRHEDWVVDVIALRDEMEVLNEIFTNPNIVKVFHGAESDVVWLQQDFNLYIVNLFDTFHASKLLEFPRHGLANLLEMYCDYIPDKRYQLADWRIRPLPEEMLEYARSDTHFLLYIYDNLRNALLDRATSRSQSRSRSSSPPTPLPIHNNPSNNPAHTLIDQVLARSAETSLRVYTKDSYDHSGGGSTGWDALAKKWNKIMFTSSAPSTGTGGGGIPEMQINVYKAIHWWRERVSREEDESTRYVLPNHFLFQIAEQMPSDLAALLRIFSSSMPPVIKKRAKDLLEAIREAVKSSLEKQKKKVIGIQEVEVERVDDGKKDALRTPEVVEVTQNSGDKLWGMNATTTNAIVKTSSSLFGTAKAKSHQDPTSETQTPSSTVYTAERSALFQDHKIKKQPVSSSSLPIKQQPSSTNLRFQELVARINSTLIIVPSVPKIKNETANKAIEVDESTGMQIEVPFVPASQRQTTSLSSSLKIEEKEKDTIIVVGQARQKRKRKEKSGIVREPQETKTTATSTSNGSSGGEEKGEDEDEGKPFDFNSVPNILDDNPDAEHKKPMRKRQKKTKSAGQFYGDFPAPPRAHSEYKGGNQSYTFK